MTKTMIMVNLMRMKMMIKLSNIVSPNRIVGEMGDAYDDYVDKVTTTNNYVNNMHKAYYEKIKHNDVSKEKILHNIYRVLFASYLELFILDDTPDMFYFVFKDYVHGVISRTEHRIYRDEQMNSIFHLDAHNGNRYDAYSRIFKLYYEDHPECKLSMMDDLNIDNVKLITILNNN